MNAQSIADRMAISDVIHRYCRAMDRIDVELDGAGELGHAAQIFSTHTVGFS